MRCEDPAIMGKTVSMNGEKEEKESGETTHPRVKSGPA
jgi:hypothetical protein